MPDRMHADQVDLDLHVVRRMLADQHPELAGLPLVEVPSVGTVNAVYRLGDDLCVRLPLQPSGDRALARELEWLAWLAPRLPVPVPEPVTVGEPDDRYPHRWAVYRWIDGTTVADVALGPVEQAALADDLAEVVAAIGGLDPTGAPRADNRWALRHLDPGIRQLLPRTAADGVDVARATAAWDGAVAAPAFAGPPTWVHGDLLAANLLLRDGRLAALLDWGGAGTGDPACDLYPAWLLAPPARARFRAALEVDDAAWARSRGWALRTPIQGLAYYRDTNPGFVAMSRRVLDAVLPA